MTKFRLYPSFSMCWRRMRTQSEWKVQSVGRASGSAPRASDFGPLPKEVLAIVGKDELEIRFAFHYR